MIQLGNDYGKGAHERIIRRIIAENMVSHSGYGMDSLTAGARDCVLEACGLREGDVHFLTGGTQTNAVAIDWLSRPSEGVLSTSDAHINVHEAGAIECCGHKVIPIQNGSDKLTAADVEEFMNKFYSDATWPHMVIPGVVYISQPTELGSLYGKEELEKLRIVCDKYGLKLYIDGARLAYALGADGNDVTLIDLAHIADAFYIGGTKCGTLFGEALVLPGVKSEREKCRLFNHVKRHGALHAKGWLVAAQFDEMLKDGLYASLGKHAVSLALQLRKGLSGKGIKAWKESPTNQQFFVVPQETLNHIKGKVGYDVWGTPEETKSVIRLVTDWSTTEGDIAAVLNLF